MPEGVRGRGGEREGLQHLEISGPQRGLRTYNQEFHGGRNEVNVFPGEKLALS